VEEQGLLLTQEKWQDALPRSARFKNWQIGGHGSLRNLEIAEVGFLRRGVSRPEHENLAAFLPIKWTGRFDVKCSNCLRESFLCTTTAPRKLSLTR